LADRDDGEKLICKNRNAFRNFEIGERLEAGIVLVGSEVKSLRDGGGNLVDAYAALDPHRRGQRRELWLYGAHFAPYSHAAFPHEPVRARKLLVHRAQLLRLATKLNERGFTLVPIRMYFKKGRVKIELGLGKGKKFHDRRADLKKRDVDRELREIKRVRR